MSYLIEIVRRAEKEYLTLPQSVQGRIRRKILSLEDDPRPHGSRKLRESDYYRIRVGDYRIIYSIKDESMTVAILSIAHRREAYR